jgi:protease I
VDRNPVHDSAACLPREPALERRDGHVACRIPASRDAPFQLTRKPMTQPHPLDGLKIAILVDDLFEQAELAEPKKALEAAGATVHIVSPKGPKVTGMKHDQKGDSFAVDVPLAQAKSDEYDGLVLPGGVVNADALRMVDAARRFAKDFDQAGKPIAVVCHGPWLLISAGLASGRTLTSWPSLQDDLRNAGAKWVDREVVSDGNWTSSRKPDDLPAFNREFIAALQRTPAKRAMAMPLAD